MAKYKNREVLVVKEFPNTMGDMVQIEHLEPGVSGTEIVPKSQVWVSDDEKKGLEKTRDQLKSDNDYKVLGKDDENLPATAPSVNSVKVQRMAEDNLVRAEEQKKKQEEWNKQHPNLGTDQKKQLDAIKVVPYRDEKPAKANQGGKVENQRTVEARDAALKNKVV